LPKRAVSLPFTALPTLVVLAADEEAAERSQCKKERKHVYAVNLGQLRKIGTSTATKGCGEA